jgi:hypothetical protein
VARWYSPRRPSIPPRCPVPIHDIRVLFRGAAPRHFHAETGEVLPRVRHASDRTVVELPPLAIHARLVGERG